MAGKAVLFPVIFSKKRIMKNTILKYTMLIAFLAIPFCQALAENKPIVIGNSRFTFITDNLVRLEYARHQKFLEDSTLFAVNRESGNMKVVVKKRAVSTFSLHRP